jgi:cold shock CspA family protein
MKSGSPYRVRVDVTVPPGHEFVGRREPGQGEMHEQLETVIKDVFESVERQLDEISERQDGNVKSHPAQEANALVDRVFRSKEHGFLKSIDSGQDIYFHKNSVTNNDFDRLQPGTGVYYEAEMGDDGYQATTVRVVDKPGERRGK